MLKSKHRWLYVLPVILGLLVSMYFYWVESTRSQEEYRRIVEERKASLDIIVELGQRTIQDADFDKELLFDTMQSAVCMLNVYSNFYGAILDDEFAVLHVSRSKELWPQNNDMILCQIQTSFTDEFSGSGHVNVTCDLGHDMELFYRQIPTSGDACYVVVIGFCVNHVFVMDPLFLVGAIFIVMLTVIASYVLLGLHKKGCNNCRKGV